MIRYLNLGEVLQLHRQVMERFGGAMGIRDLGGLESALAQPRATFGGKELYPTLAEQAAALGFSLVQNHPFVDGNKRTGHAAMETFLVLNGCSIDADVNEQEQVILRIARGEWRRDALASWLRAHVVELNE